MTTPDLWKTLVVPTDLSEHSLAALKTAATLQQRSGATVILLHVTEPAYEGLRIHTEDLHGRMMNEAETKLKKLAAEYFPDATAVCVMVKEGRPADTICRTAAEANGDAIIIPTHGHSGLKHVLLGSVAEKVVRHARCSVLVVR